MKNLPLKFKRILGTIIVIAFCFFIAITLKAFFVPETITPNEPQRLSSALIKNIEENPNDWMLTESNDTIHIMGISNDEILENKKCNIKILFTSSKYSYAHLVSPDSIDFDDDEGLSIYSTYTAIKRKVEERKLDSIYAFKEKIKIVKEQKILSKLCK